MAASVAFQLRPLVALLFILVSTGETAIPCPDGHYCPIGTTVPIPCPPGTKSWRYVVDRTSCQNCSNGYYQDKPGQKDCYECPQGYKCPVPRTHATQCPPGTKSWRYVVDRTSCQDCSNGYYQDKAGQKDCYECPQGYKCPVPRTQATQCPPGTKSWRYVVDRTSCQNCSSGYYQDKPGQRNCLDCPQGHQCPFPRTRAIPCPSGTMSWRNVVDRTDCNKCPIGYYQEKSGQNKCLPCPSGHYCPAARNSAIPCPAGSVNWRNIVDRDNCAVCSNGYYQEKAGQSKCLLCPEGRECPSPKNGSIPCPPGYQNGYYRHIQDRVNCLACGAGYYQTKTEQTRCNYCPDQHYCPQKENGPLPCPPGFTSASIASQKVSCVRCLPGKCLDPVPPPVVCQPGMFLDVDTKSCKPCETGDYQPHSGQSSCQICPEGFYCPSTTTKPVPCPKGTYSTSEMGLRTACINCSAGTYQMQEGQNFCLACPVGYFCPRPNLNPKPCLPGTYATQDTTDRTKCQPCSAQNYQDQEGQENCKRCPAGYLCPRPDLSPQQCSPHTYSTYDQTDRSKCLPCPRGQYQDHCGQQDCKNIFEDGTIPTPEPSLTCPNLNTSDVVNDDQIICTERSRSAYSGSSVRFVEGNNGVQYPVVKIRPEHLSVGINVTDNEIVVSTALAFDKMATSAKRESVIITINSAFRGYERQKYLHDCYNSSNCNNGNPAAPPGTSRHGTGVALDLNTNCGKQEEEDQNPSKCNSSRVYMWLKNNAHSFGFLRTVKVEPWHWEFQGGPVTGRSNFT